MGLYFRVIPNSVMTFSIQVLFYLAQQSSSSFLYKDRPVAGNHGKVRLPLPWLAGIRQFQVIVTNDLEITLSLADTLCLIQV